MVDHREAILAFIREKGPTLPAAVAKHMKMELLFASAHLAEMTETGKLKASWLKIGGSPLYFIPGQELLLENFSENLGEKDKRAYVLLKQEKLVKEDDLDPLTRVSIKGLKDFAVPVVVTHDNVQEQYWKFHSVSNDEVQQILKSRMKPAEAEPTMPKVQKKKLLKEEQKALLHQEQKPSLRKMKKTRDKLPDTFATDVSTFFEKNGIVVKERTMQRKGELDFIIHIPSVVGQLEHYCRAKNKKKITDVDISSVYVQAQARKLPAIVLSPGEPTKKAVEVLSTLKGITLYRLG
jgi:hypothetical protein